MKNRRSMTGLLALLVVLALTLLWIWTGHAELDVAPEDQIESGTDRALHSPRSGQEADDTARAMQGAAHDSNETRRELSGTIPTSEIQIIRAEDGMPLKAIVEVDYLLQGALLRGSVVSDAAGRFHLPKRGAYSLRLKATGMKWRFLPYLLIGKVEKTIYLRMERSGDFRLVLKSPKGTNVTNFPALVIPSHPRSGIGWRRSPCLQKPDVLTWLQEKLRQSRKAAPGPETMATLEQHFLRDRGGRGMSEVWVPYLGTAWFWMSSDSRGECVWKNVPETFRWGIKSNQITATVTPAYELKQYSESARGIVDRGRMPRMLSGPVEMKPGQTVEIRCVVNVGNSVDGLMPVSQDYDLIQGVFLRSLFQTSHKGTKVEEWQAEQRSPLLPGGQFGFHGVRPGKKRVTAVFRDVSQSSYRFFSQEFDYGGGALHLGALLPLRGKDAIIGLKSHNGSLVGMAIDANLLFSSKDALGSKLGFGLETKLIPGKQIRLEGAQGAQVFLELDRRGTLKNQGIRLSKRSHVIPRLVASNWVVIEIPILKPVEIDCVFSVPMSASDSLVGFAALADGTGVWCDTKTRPGGSKFLILRASVSPIFIYGYVSSRRGDRLAAGMNSLGRVRRKLHLVKGGSLTLELSKGKSADTASLIAASLYGKGFMVTPWRQQFHAGKVVFKGIPFPARYGIMLDGKKYGLIELNQPNQVHSIR